ncbi:MAG: hypothetical protein JSU63_06065 [Phycisphaerales bacterium]|nr:MAG: hypothetical protein JSU63_06065 [Phycisphaerales bacterium]
MKGTVVCACALGVLLGCLVDTVSSKESADALISDIVIAVSPSTIVLGCDKGSSVTVHADIPFASVDRASVEMDGVVPYLTKADNRGDLVAKFNQQAIEAIVAPPAFTFTLTGVTVGGEPFSGSDTVRVMVDPSPED